MINRLVRVSDDDELMPYEVLLHALHTIVALMQPPTAPFPNSVNPRCARHWPELAGHSLVAFMFAAGM